MTKRFLAFALALVMIISLLPVAGVSAEGKHIHCLCGETTILNEECSVCKNKAVEWTATSTMPTASGHYYLTGDVSAAAQFLENQDISLCLNGHKVTSAAGKKFLYLNKNVTYNISDCTAKVEEDVYTAGCFTGATGVDTYGSTMRVNASCVLNLYDGIITGNAAKDSGVIYVDGSSSAATPAGTFNMYGGEISGNTCQRGTVCGVSTGTNKPVIRILGGKITGNNALGTGAQAGGGGICAFSPVEVGGDAKIFGNAATLGGADIYLRNDGSFTGKLVISAEHPLTEGAQVNYSLYTAESNLKNLQYITGNPETWESGWVVLDGENVNFRGGVFYQGEAPAPELPGTHVHCLCGAQWDENKTCTTCGSKAVLWTETDTLPTTSGNYCLSGHVTTAPVTPAANAQINICLNGYTITSAAGRKIWYLTSNASVTVTDCAENAGKITGVTSDSVVQVATSGAFTLYNGKITGNTNTGEGIILLAQGNTTTAGGTFNMYGGEITGNTCKRGTIMMTNPTGSNLAAVVRIFGGIITGNHATGTTATTGGGAGIVAMSPVEIGGTAKIYGNTAAAGVADVFLRNDQKAKIVISSAKPLTDGAKVVAGLYVAESDPTNLQTVSGAPAQWQESWLTLDESSVAYANGKFYLTAAESHFHCLCGAATELGKTCESCGSKVVSWGAADAMPKDSGYYYLTADISTAAVIPNPDAQIAICLHGQKITSAAGKKIWYLSKNVSVTVTDCAEEEGIITGVTADNVCQVDAGCTFTMYGGKITGNTNPGTGIVLLSKGSAIANGGTFIMYGGEISGNTVQRGTIMMTNVTEEIKDCVVRIFGGVITGNHATGTTAVNGGGAGILAMSPIEIGGNAQIYGNTAVAGEPDIFLRNDQKGKMIISAEHPLTEGAKIGCGAYVNETDPAALQYVTGNPTNWDPAWVTYCGEPLRWEEGKFTIEKQIVWSEHQHGDQQWISVTEETGLLPDATGYYVLDADLQLKAELKIMPDQDVTLCLNGHDLLAAPGLRHIYVASGGKLTICDCTATEKDGVYTAGRITGADGTAGGGAIRMAANAVVNLYSGMITGNHTTGEGGAFYLEACNASHTTPAVLNLYGGEISNNVADKGYGAAIRFAAAAEGFQAATFHMEGGYIRDHVSPNYGGAIHAPGGATIELLGGVIENNKAVAGGGAISVNGATTVTLDGAIIRNNSAEKWGGGIYLKTGATMIMKSGEVSGNSSKIGAGILLESEGTNLTLEGGKIAKNKAGTAGGGGIYVGIKTKLTMEGGEICSNTSEAGGAGLSCVTGEVMMNGGSICHNTATSWGAGTLVSTDAKFTMNGGSISSNYTPKSAAAMYAWCSEIVINKGSIENNIAKDCVGGIRSVGAKLTINGGSITGNEGQTNSGAAVMGEQASRKIDGVKYSIPSTIVMRGGSISYNKAAKAGSGVIIQSKGSTFTMYGGTISHNHAGKFAGAVYVGKGAFFNMHGGEICYNTMETDGASAVLHDGGGSHTGGAIHHNTTPKSGSFAVSGEGNVVNAKGLKIYENNAKVAGGVLVQSKATLNMEDCEIYNNHTTFYGAGVYLYTYVTLNLKNCKIYNNVSDIDGGGLWTWATANMSLDGCEITGNEAANDGGGFWTRGENIYIKNTTNISNGYYFIRNTIFYT